MVDLFLCSDVQGLKKNISKLAHPNVLMTLLQARICIDVDVDVHGSDIDIDIYVPLVILSAVHIQFWLNQKLRDIRAQSCMLF